MKVLKLKTIIQEMNLKTTLGIWKLLDKRKIKEKPQNRILNLILKGITKIFRKTNKQKKIVKLIMKKKNK